MLSKKTIFIRILAATLLPLILIFSLVIFTINDLIFREATFYAKENTILFADKVSIQVKSLFDNLADLAHMGSRSLSGIDAKLPENEIRKTSESILRSVFDVSQEPYNVWFAFEPGAFTFNSEKRFSQSFIRDKKGIYETFDMYDELLDDPKESPWYQIPVSEGRPFLDTADPYDYGVGEGLIYAAGVTYPIIRNGKVIGAFGIDVQYLHTLRPLEGIHIPEGRRVALISEDGTIVYSSNEELVGRSLSSFGFSREKNIQAHMQKNKIFMGETFSSFYDEEFFIYIRPLDMKNAVNSLFLYVELPTSVLKNKGDNAVQIVVSTSIIGLLLVAASVFFATRNIVKPVKRITEKANKIADGQLDVVFDDINESETIQNEIDQLQVALKKMVSQLTQVHNFKLAAVSAKFEKEKMKETEQAKMQFFASMSHEIRTPMNAILGISDLLLAENMSDKQVNYVRDIKISADALLTTINDILDFSKMETGNFVLSPVHYRFPMLLENVVSIITMIAKDKNLAFEYLPEDNLPDYLYGDDIRLRQILLNLLSNAVKYTKKGYIKLTIATENEKLHFKITDSGQGIKESALATIFEPFIQVDEKENRQIQGTGLGLTITRKLVLMMGGEIYVESVYGQGSTFHVKIPRVLGDASQIAKVDSTQSKLYAPSAKVLVVDDNDVNINVAVGLLSLFGIQSDAVLSGIDAIEKIQENDYDIVFMDHMMPEMDGVEATEKIRALGGKYESLIIVALTANAIVGTKEMLIQKGMNDFLSKPIILEKLQDILVTWLPDDKKETKTEKDQEDATLQADVSASPLLARAGMISGLDVALGLDRVGKQQTVFEKSLRLIARRIPEFLAETRTALAQDMLDMAKFHIEIHGMKGSLANIGATVLADQALSLEMALKKQDASFKLRLPSFLKQLEAFGNAVSELFEGEAEKNDQKPDGNDILLNAQIKALYQVLSDYDYDGAVEKLQTLQQYQFDQRIEQRLQEISELLDQFDYEGALAAIRQHFGQLIESPGSL